MQILICEDEQDIRDLLEIVVSEMDSDVILSDNLEDVNRILESRPVDVILMDYWFKNTDASHTIRQLKSSSKHAHIPIVLISAIHNLASVAQGLGTEAYIKKPFNIDELVQTIYHLTQHAKENSNN